MLTTVLFKGQNVSFVRSFKTFCNHYAIVQNSFNFRVEYIQYACEWVRIFCFVLFVMRQMVPIFIRFHTHKKRFNCHFQESTYIQVDFNVELVFTFTQTLDMCASSRLNVSLICFPVSRKKWRRRRRIEINAALAKDDEMRFLIVSFILPIGLKNILNKTVPRQTKQM